MLYELSNQELTTINGGDSAGAGLADAIIFAGLGLMATPGGQVPGAIVTGVGLLVAFGDWLDETFDNNYYKIA